MDDRKHPSGYRYARPMRILKQLLEHGPLTRREISEWGLMSTEGLPEPLRRLLRGELIPLAPMRITTWRLNGAAYAPVYAIGNARDTPRRTMSRSEQSRRFRAKYQALLVARKRVKRGRPVGLFV